MAVKVEGQSNKNVNVGPGAQGNRAGVKIQHHTGGSPTNTPQVTVSTTSSGNTQSTDSPTTTGEDNSLVNQEITVNKEGDPLNGNTGTVKSVTGNLATVNFPAYGDRQYQLSELTTTESNDSNKDSDSDNE